MSKRDELRKVMLSKYEDGSGDFNIPGYFHSIGTVIGHSNNDTYPLSVAIVELEDGKLVTVKIQRVQFVDN